MAEDVLIVIDQQKAMDHPKWGPRNNPGAEANIARLLTDWRRRGAAVEPIVHVKNDGTSADSPFRPGQEGNDLLPNMPRSRRSARFSPTCGDAAQPSSSVMTLKLTSVLGPNVWVIGTSAASRPRPIRMRPMRGALLRASNGYH